MSQRPHRRLFRRAEAFDSTGFLELRSAMFAEHDAAGAVCTRKPLELVSPRPTSLNTVAVAVLCRIGDRVCLALDDDDLPASQCFDGNSEILVTPAWRLPRQVRGIAATRRWIEGRLEAEYGLASVACFELGGRYHPSPGLTPEVVHPLAIEVAGAGRGPRPLCWVELGDAIGERAALVDGHLRVVSWRAAHALGLLGALPASSEAR